MKSLPQLTLSKIERRMSKKLNKQSISQQQQQCSVKLEFQVMRRVKKQAWLQNPRKIMMLKILMKTLISLSQKTLINRQNNRVNYYEATYLTKLDRQKRVKGLAKTVATNSGINPKKNKNPNNKHFQIYHLLKKMLEGTVLTSWPYLQAMSKTTMVKNSRNLNYLGWLTEKAMQPRV